MGDGRFIYKNMDNFECCANCRYLVSFPRNNKYNDNDHLCLITNDLGSIECMLVVDGEYEDSIGLDEFVDKFYSNMIEKILNVVTTQE